MMTSGESETMLTKYLLNEVSEDERERIEEQLFIDRDFFEQVRMAEIRLIDRYVLREMADDENERFKSRYLPVPEHRRRVREAELFHEQLKSIRSEYERGPNKRRADRKTFFAWAKHFGTPTFGATAALASVVLAVTGAVILTQQGAEFATVVNANQILNVGVPPSPPPPAVPSTSPAITTEEPAAPATPLHRTTPPPTPEPSAPNSSGRWLATQDTIPMQSKIKRTYAGGIHSRAAEIAPRAWPVINFQSRESYSDPDLNFEVKYSGRGKGKWAEGVWLLNVKRAFKTIYLVPNGRVYDDDEIAILWTGERGCAEGHGGPVKFQTEREGGRIVRVLVPFEGLSEGSYLFKVKKVLRCFDLRFAEE